MAVGDLGWSPTLLLEVAVVAMFIGAAVATAAGLRPEVRPAEPDA
jgi:hypothetical protein